MLYNPNPTPMNPEWKTIWTAALRSGSYEQGRASLRQRTLDPTPGLEAMGYKFTFCCLGVLCDLYAMKTNQGIWDDARGGFVIEFPDISRHKLEELASGLLDFDDRDRPADYLQHEESLLPAKIAYELGINRDTQNWLAALNDGREEDDGSRSVFTFAQIADKIEEVL